MRGCGRGSERPHAALLDRFFLLRSLVMLSCLFFHSSLISSSFSSVMSSSPSHSTGVLKTIFLSSSRSTRARNSSAVLVKLHATNIPSCALPNEA